MLLKDWPNNSEINSKIADLSVFGNTSVIFLRSRKFYCREQELYKTEASGPQFSHTEINRKGTLPDYTA
jgi:hypothetical protein